LRRTNQQWTVGTEALTLFRCPVIVSLRPEIGAMFIQGLGRHCVSIVGCLTGYMFSSSDYPVFHAAAEGR
jgi:hypothetical protein